MTLISEEIEKINESNSSMLKSSGQLKVALASLLKSIEDFQNNILKDKDMLLVTTKTDLSKLLQNLVDEINKTAEMSDTFIKVNDEPKAKPVVKKKIQVSQKKKIV